MQIVLPLVHLVRKKTAVTITTMISKFSSVWKLHNRVRGPKSREYIVREIALYQFIVHSFRATTQPFEREHFYCISFISPQCTLRLEESRHLAAENRPQVPRQVEVKGSEVVLDQVQVRAQAVAVGGGGVCSDASMLGFHDEGMFARTGVG